MFQDAQSLTAESRPLGVSARRDLVIEQGLYQGEYCWVVKDPVALKYYRLQGPEYEVLRLLEGDISLDQLKTHLTQTFPEKSFRIGDLQSLIASFHQNGLLVTRQGRQAEVLFKRRRKQIKQKLVGLVSSVLAIKFPGFDPDRILNFVTPLFGWVFSRWFAFLALAFGASAGILLLSHLNEFYQRLPDFQSFFSIRNVFTMGILLIGIKIVHEFGHGIACKRFGGECHEIGFMLLVLMPAMYCNTSDSWILSNKWKRIVIGAAGMYFELIMASICTWIWWYTHPGWIHYLSLNVMFICSVSTIMFNGNPLLRYDGYYILSDFLEIPNLAQKSRMSLVSKLRVWCLGLPPVPKRMLPSRNQVWFAIYSIASFFYRWFVVLSIYWFLLKFFEPYGLEVVGHIIVTISIVSMFAMPGWQMLKYFRYPGRIRQIKRPRLIVTTIILSIVLGVLFSIPFPNEISGPVVIRSENASHIYVRTPGVLVKCNVKVGQPVKKGDILAQLENISLEHSLLELQAEQTRLKQEITGYLRMTALDLKASEALTQAQTNLLTVDEQIKTLQNQIDELVLVAPVSGIVLPPPHRELPLESKESLPIWKGSPLDSENLKAMLDPETHFCTIGDPNSNKAIVVVDQSDVQLVKLNQPVQIMLDEYPGIRIRSSVGEISRSNLEKAPVELAGASGGPLPVNPESGNQQELLFNSYEVSIPLEDLDRTINAGFRGRARIQVNNATVFQRLYRWISTVTTFR